MKKQLILLILITFSVIMLSACNGDEASEKKEATIEATTEAVTAATTESVTEATTQTDNNNMDDSDAASILGENFKEAVSSIGMDPKSVKNIKQLDNWSSGKRYSFVYDGCRYICYLLDNGEVNSICNGNKSVKIYERGYEPLNYKDFEPDGTILDSLMELGIKELSKYILNENKIRTKLGSTEFYRIYDYYSFNGDIVAKNNIDKKDYTFTVDFLVDGDTATCKYVAINGKDYYGTQDGIIPEVKKKKIETKSNNKNKDEDTIIITDGEKGEYGKYDDFNGEKYLRYYIPAGKYKVTCNVSGGFYVESVKLHDEDGWDTPTTYGEYMMKAGNTETVTIKKGQCISLIINTELEFNKTN